jgi:hypothetical protein
MLNKKESDNATRANIKKEMAKPRLAKSVRIAELNLAAERIPGRARKTMSGTVGKIILSLRPNQPEKAQLAGAGAGDQSLVNGKSTNEVVLQVDGHSYISIETFAQITNGLVEFEPRQIVLIIPNSNFDANSPQATPALSKDFASAAIATLADMKEWKGVLGTMVTFGLAVDGSWAQVYHERVQTSLEQATVAASTNSDHNALELLSAQFSNLAKWESAVVTERQSHNGSRTVAPNSLQNDPVLTKERSLLDGVFCLGFVGSPPGSENSYTAHERRHAKDSRYRIRFVLYLRRWKVRRACNNLF